MPLRSVAFGLSLLVHGGLVAAIVTVQMSADAAPRTIQLNGTRQERQAGRDLLHEVLVRPGIPIRLTSPVGNAAVGLAWWSPTVGLWLAADRLPASVSNRSLQVAMQVDGGAAVPIGEMNVDDEGSGRIVAAWVQPRPAPGVRVSLIVSDAGSLLRWRDPMTMIAGTAAMR
jgi:hypothetical protein